MITEFLWLTLLTLKENEIEALRGKFDEWLKCFLPKLKRESTRTAKCRLLASVERHEFGDKWNAENWRFCKFDGNKGILFDKDKKQLEEFEATSFQKHQKQQRLRKCWFRCFLRTMLDASQFFLKL